ncbi:MAG: hypothetical protein A3I72_07505 [Candidatus Tectomicrobia bacterium RIFCSPLOWO2_02_FULL_70_19]|nr:MAG: hypothetical protein A3I72_07505 [Candidatus Tectomicrobia bacterium RIFCSPLOWO2_02_FULL_70_19]
MFHIAMKALDRSGPDRGELRNQTERTKEFVGITGIFDCWPADHHGLDSRAVVLVSIEGGVCRLTKREAHR